MNCCGKKRAAYNSSNSKPSLQAGQGEASTVRTKRSNAVPVDAMFRYTGNKSLVIRGASGQRTYQFSAGNQDVMVFAEDAAMMRAYPELTELKK